MAGTVRLSVEDTVRLSVEGTVRLLVGGTVRLLAGGTLRLLVVDMRWDQFQDMGVEHHRCRHTQL